MIHRSPRPEVDIPAISITQLVLRRDNIEPGRPAIVDGVSGEVLTYGQLVERARRLAVGLRGRGFGAGDTLAIYSPNIPDYAVALHGTIAAGAAVTTVTPLATARELANQLRDSGATYLLTHVALLDNATEAAAQVGLSDVFVFGEAAGVPSFNLLLAEDGPWPELDIDAHEHVAVMPYSSGTTGLPKGVMLSHHNLVSNVCQGDAAGVVDGTDTTVAFLPFFHVYGIWVFLLLSLAKGATIVTMPRFDLEQFLQLNQDHKATRLIVVPPVLLALAKHPVVDDYDLSSVRSIMSGAAPASGELCDTVTQRLGCVVHQAWGLTETSPAVTVQPMDGRGAGSCGLLVSNTEARIVDAKSGQDLNVGEQGEVWIRGPQVMLGYLNKPEATAAMMTADGWLKTGDIGSIDGEGYVSIVDRLKELIKVNAFQVAPAELEGLLLTHPNISDAAVIGLPDDERGEIPKAFIVARGEANADEIMAWVASQVAPYKRIRQVEFIEQVPKSASGKILRSVLRERERAKQPIA